MMKCACVCCVCAVGCVRTNLGVGVGPGAVLDNEAQREQPAEALVVQVPFRWHEPHRVYVKMTAAPNCDPGNLRLANSKDLESESPHTTSQCNPNINATTGTEESFLHSNVAVYSEQDGTPHYRRQAKP